MRNPGKAPFRVAEPVWSADAEDTSKGMTTTTIRGQRPRRAGVLLALLISVCLCGDLSSQAEAAPPYKGTLPCNTFKRQGQFSYLVSCSFGNNWGTTWNTPGGGVLCIRDISGSHQVYIMDTADGPFSRYPGSPDCLWANIPTSQRWPLK